MQQTIKYILLGLVIIVIAGILLSRSTAPLGSMAINRFSSATTATTSIGSTATVVLSANSGRVYARIDNSSTVTSTTLYFGATTSAVIGLGVKLEAGEYYEITPLNLYVGQISGIAASTITISTIEE